MTNPSKKYADRGPLTNEEIDLMLRAADLLKTEYFRKRAKALIALLKKFGKRRSEIARLTVDDLKINEKNHDLEVTFTLSKKHKRGLFQYLEFLKEQNNPELLNKPYPLLVEEWRKWQQTEEGHRIKNDTSLQSISLDDKYTTYILDYLRYMKATVRDAKFLFPSGTEVFGGAYIIVPREHLSGSQLLRIIKPLNNTAWLHLFRETKGAEIAKNEGRTIDAVYKVKENLDLENEDTAYHYVRRFAALKQPTEK